jgi:hypothetical protein
MVATGPDHGDGGSGACGPGVTGVRPAPVSRGEKLRPSSAPLQGDGVGSTAWSLAALKRDFLPTSRAPCGLSSGSRENIPGRAAFLIQLFARSAWRADVKQCQLANSGSLMSSQPVPRARLARLLASLRLAVRPARDEEPQPRLQTAKTGRPSAGPRRLRRAGRSAVCNQRARGAGRTDPIGHVTSRGSSFAPNAGIFCGSRACAQGRMSVLGRREETHDEKLPRH